MRPEGPGRPPFAFSPIRATTFVIALFLTQLTALGVEGPDSLFLPSAARSDRAAGIGKRVKPGATLELARISGPAIIRHFWMTNIRPVEPIIESGRVQLQIYWDDHAVPDLTIPLHEFFGRRFTDANERSFRMDLGKNAYYPMPFRKSARIEIRNDSDTELVGVYWNIDYDKFDQLPDDAEYFTAATRIAAPAAPAKPAIGANELRGSGELPAGGRLTLASLNGPAVIRRLAIRPEQPGRGNDPAIGRGVIVRIWWDHETGPSVEVPLADFFGTGFGERRAFSSEAWVQDGTGLEIRFPMPFRRASRIELANVAPRPAGQFTWRIVQEPGELPADVEYLHACFRISQPVPLNSTHPAMEAKGRGKFVGLVWSCHWLNAEQKPEGTYNFWVDGVRIQATGSEDYFGRAWGFGREPLVHGYKGINLGPEKSASSDVPAEWRRVTAYRAHVLDPIHFQHSLKLDFTCYGYNRGHRTDDYATASFWYQTEPHAAFEPLPAYEDLLPLDHPESFAFGMLQITRAEADGDRVAALERTEALLRAYPRNPKAADLRFKRGCLLEELGRRTDALTAFEDIRRSRAHEELARDAADKIWLLEQPGRLLLKAAAPARADIYLDGRKIELPPEMLEVVPPWGWPQLYRFTYPAFEVAWSSPSSAVMRLPAVRIDAGVGRHVIAVKASAATREPIFTPRVGYFFATLDVAGPDTVTDATWRVATSVPDNWFTIDCDDGGWPRATSHPLSAFGDGAWTWLWPRGFRLFPGRMQRIWTEPIFPEDRNFRDTVFIRKTFEITR